MKKLGKYEIRQELGKGAMGVVYEGFDPFIKRIVAIKTVDKSLLNSAEAQDRLNRFRVEAQAAGRLTHPNIVAIYEYNEDDQVAFIAMEFIRGKELKAYFDSEQRFQIKDAVGIMSQLLEALDYSHKFGVVHRDIKPSNIIITEDGQVKVADFGIARIESSHLTQVGTVLGTPTHMSPEQFMGIVVDRRTDIYSAGVILYQFITGETPFTGSVVNIMHKTLNQEPVPPSALNFNAPKALDHVVKKAMAKRPEDRFQTASEFLQALKIATESISNDVHNTQNQNANYSTDSTLVAPEPSSFGITASNTELDLWKSIKSSQDLRDFLYYIQKYPDGDFIELAKLRITSLEPANNINTFEDQQQSSEEFRLQKEWAEADARRRADQARLENEWAEAEAKLKAEQARLERDRAEADARRKAEQARLERDRAEADARRKAEQARLEREKAEAEARRKAEQARIEKERAEAEALRKIEQARLEKERADAEAEAHRKAELARLERERAEAEARRKAEQARLEKEKTDEEARRKAEQAQLDKEKAEADAHRKAELAQLEKERAEAEVHSKAEQAQLDKEKAETQAKIQAEKVRLENAKVEAQAKIQAEKARLEKEKNEAQAYRKAELARLEKDKAEVEAIIKVEQAKFEKEKAEAEALSKAEQAQLEKQKSEAQAKLKAEQARLEKEKAEVQAQRKAELARLEKEKIETQAKLKAEQARLEKEKTETQAKLKAEQARLEKERAAIKVINLDAITEDPNQTVIVKTQPNIKKKSPAIPILAGIAVLVIGVGIWLFTRSTHEASPTATTSSVSPTPSPANQQVTSAPEKISPIAPQNQPEAPASQAENDTHSEAETKLKALQARLKNEREKALSMSKAEKDQLENELAKAQANLKTEQARLDKERAEAKRIAETAEQARLDKEKAEAKRIAETAEQARLDKEKAEAKRIADAAEQARLDKEKAEAKRIADEAPKAASLFQQAQNYENSGDMSKAMKSYIASANGGYCSAMKKLGEIYGKGNDIVPRDYAAQIKWNNKAKQACADSGVNDKADLKR